MLEYCVGCTGVRMSCFDALCDGVSRVQRSVQLRQLGELADSTRAPNTRRNVQETAMDSPSGCSRVLAGQTRSMQGGSDGVMT